MKTQKMKEIKKNLISLPTPSNISYLWNMGSILAMCLSLQIITGIMISMQFSTNLMSTFEQVMMVSRNITSGWPLRMLHTLGATLFFVFMFTHMSRNLWINSPKTKQKTWITGMIMLILTMMTAFLGYVLPWGQMSFWGATVITNMLSAIPYLGKSAVTWLWGNFSVSQPTLNRFFSLHFLMPMVIAMLSLIHLMSLHSTGSSTTTSNMTMMEKTSFHPYFSAKDTTPLLLIMLVSMLIITHAPYSTLDSENFMEANPLSTPTHIQPEWYFLFAYAILRAIPSKLGGVLALMASILVFMLPMMTKKSMSTTKFKPTKKLKLWSILSILLILTWIGANPVEDPYVKTGQVTSTIFFLMMIMAMNCFLHKIKPWKFNKESFLEN